MPRVGAEDKREQRARNPDYFSGYFLFRLAATTVSDAEVDDRVRRLNAIPDAPEADAISAATVILSKTLERHGEQQAQVLDHLVVRAPEIEPQKRIVIALAVGGAALRWADVPQGGWENTPEDRAIACDRSC
jgi:hypothetical protein